MKNKKFKIECTEQDLKTDRWNDIPWIIPDDIYEAVDEEEALEIFLDNTRDGLNIGVSFNFNVPNIEIIDNFEDVYEDELSTYSDNLFNEVDDNFIKTFKNTVVFDYKKNEIFDFTNNKRTCYEAIELKEED